MRFVAFTFILLSFLGSQSYLALCGSACLGQLLWGEKASSQPVMETTTSCHESLIQSDTASSSQTKLSQTKCFHSIDLAARQGHEDDQQLDFSFPTAYSYSSFALLTQQWILSSTVPLIAGPPLYLRYQSLVI